MLIVISSCYNCLGVWPPGSTSTSTQANNYEWCVVFFRYFKAKFYCVSSNPFGAAPNPDAYTLSAFVDGYLQWWTSNDGKTTMTIPDAYKTTHLILTNGISYNSWRIFSDRAEEAQKVGVTVKLWFLPRYRCRMSSPISCADSPNRGKSWGTIDATDGPDRGTFIDMTGFDQFCKFKAPRHNLPMARV